MLQSWGNFTNIIETINQLFPVTNVSYSNNSKLRDSHEMARYHHVWHENATAHHNASAHNNASSFHHNSYSFVLKIELAASGDSYRAMFSGAGTLAAMDDRTRGSREHGLDF